MIFKNQKNNFLLIIIEIIPSNYELKFLNIIKLLLEKVKFKFLMEETNKK
jgi:hypothetical protein